MEYSDDEESRLIISPSKCSYSSCEHDDKKTFSIHHRRLVVICILLCELCERLTYYGIVGNLILYLTIELDYTSASASSICLVWTGIAYSTPFIGGIISDSLLGKLKTIFSALFIYGVGTFILPIISIDYENVLDGSSGLTLNEQRGLYLFALTLVAIGTGGIKCTVAPFGVQQIEDLGEGVIQSFFNWYYWFINIGSIIAYSVVVYVQQEISFAWGYTIPAASILVSAVALFVGKKHYITTPPEGSALTRILKIVGEATSKSCSGSSYDDLNFLDRAKKENGGSFYREHVEQARCLVKIIPVLLCTIIYWTVYAQLQTSFVLQGERMNLVYNTFTFPVASLSVFTKASLLVLIPLMDTVIYPCFECIGFKLTQLKRMGFGMLLAALSMALATVVEVSRKDIMANGGYTEQIIANESYNASTMTVFAQVPQYFIIGASEAFTSISSMEFAYSESPKVLQGVMMGVYLLIAAMGSYVGSLLVIVVNAITKGHEWYPDEINDGYLEYFYILLGVMMLINTAIFCVIAYYYTYRNINAEQDDFDDYEDVVFTDMKIEDLLFWRDKVLSRSGSAGEYQM